MNCTRRSRIQLPANLGYTEVRTPGRTWMFLPGLALHERRRRGSGVPQIASSGDVVLVVRCVVLPAFDCHARLDVRIVSCDSFRRRAELGFPGEGVPTATLLTLVFGTGSSGNQHLQAGVRIVPRDDDTDIIRLRRRARVDERSGRDSGRWRVVGKVRRRDLVELDERWLALAHCRRVDVHGSQERIRFVWVHGNTGWVTVASRCRHRASPTIGDVLGGFGLLGILRLFRPDLRLRNGDTDLSHDRGTVKNDRLLRKLGWFRSALPSIVLAIGFRITGAVVFVVGLRHSVHG